MNLRTALRWTWRVPVLIVVYVVLFMLGTTLLGPKLPPAPAAESAAAGLGFLAMALIDTVLILAIVLSSRLHGTRLMLLTAGFFYAVKTFTSQLEAAYFMKNVTPDLLPGLFAMTLPVSLLFPVVVVLLAGRWKASAGAPSPAWEAAPMGRSELWLKITVLSVVVYPALFFLFGYYVAYASPELRAFYGDSGETTFLGQMRWLIAGDPWVVPFEWLRGLLWVGFAYPILRTTRGAWWVGTLWIALAFSLLQNDVHFIPNPLMPPTVRAYHFVETASSNFLWAWAIGWLLSRSHVSQGADVRGVSTVL